MAQPPYLRGLCDHILLSRRRGRGSAAGFAAGSGSRHKAHRFSLKTLKGPFVFNVAQCFSGCLLDAEIGHPVGNQAAGLADPFKHDFKQVVLFFSNGNLDKHQRHPYMAFFFRNKIRYGNGYKEIRHLANNGQFVAIRYGSIDYAIDIDGNIVAQRKATE